MKSEINVGVVGDFRPANHSHVATNEAIAHASAQLGIHTQVAWIPTELLDRQAEQKLQSFDALWGAPGSPYQSMEGALNGIHYARENGRPFIGT